MQVSLTSSDGLWRTVRIALPEKTVDSEVQARLVQVGRTARINGFRPGKVPMRVLAKRYRGGVLQEILDEKINVGLRDAISEHDHKIAGSPEVQRVEDADGPYVFDARYEVFPEITLAPLADLSVDRPTAEVNDSDVDEMIDTLRKQRTQFATVARPAQDADQVIIDFAGFVDGEAFEGGAAQGSELVLGSGRFIPGFEEQITGMQADEDRRIQVTFPEDYNAEALAGKTADFDIHLVEVKEPSVPELNEEFIKSLGVSESTEEGLRSAVRDNMTRELKTALIEEYSDSVIKALAEANDIAVPEAIVDRECMAMIQNMMGGDENASLPKINPRELPEEFRKESTERVKASLIYRHLLADMEITADAERVRARVEEIAASYESPAEVVDYLYNNDEAQLRQIEQYVQRAEFVERVTEKAKVIDVPTTFSEIMAKRRSESAAR